MAVKQGDAKAQINLGWMYENGKGVIQDNKEALRLYKMSAKQGNFIKAQYNVGVMYHNGKGTIKI